VVAQTEESLAPNEISFQQQLIQDCGEPWFPGGVDSLKHFISSHFSITNEIYTKGINGKIYVQ